MYCVISFYSNWMSNDSFESQDGMLSHIFFSNWYQLWVLCYKPNITNGKTLGQFFEQLYQSWGWLGPMSPVWTLLPTLWYCVAVMIFGVSLGHNLSFIMPCEHGLNCSRHVKRLRSLLLKLPNFGPLSTRRKHTYMMSLMPLAPSIHSFHIHFLYLPILPQCEQALANKTDAIGKKRTLHCPL